MDESPDKKKKKEDFKRHPFTDPYPHPKHKSQHKPVLSKDHDPHTNPDPTDESINRGVYEDRPRPAKINKRNLKLDKSIQNITSLIIMIGCIGSLVAISFTIGCVQQKQVISQPVISDGMSVYYVDVGQGDSEIIKSPSGKIMLIDAGDKGNEDNIIEILDRLNTTTIDTIVVSHPHADHIGGMIPILNKYKVNRFIESGMPTTTSLYEKMLVTIDNKNISYKTVSRGDIIEFDPSLEMRVYNPMRKSSNFNDNSVVVRMIYNNVTFLFSGDVESDMEKTFLDMGHIDILKVAHHGSDSSSSQVFLLLTKPSVSIISVGKNNVYNHPSDITLTNLYKSGSKVYRTDYNGTITVVTNGNNYIINTER